MTPAKLLQYESLCTVLFHMDANIRVLLSKGCPSIRITERDVPLKIKLLKFQHVETILNDTSYKLGIVREYPEGVEVPRIYQQNNDRGGVSWDIDKFGFRLNNGRQVLTTGDVALRKVISNPEPYTFDATWREKEMEELFEKCKKKLTRRIEMDTLEEEMAVKCAAQNQPKNTVPWFEPRYYKVPIVPLVVIEGSQLYRELEEEYYDESNPHVWMEISLRELQERKDEAEASYLPFYYRKHNMSPPFTSLLQLTIESPVGKSVHRFPYKCKLQEAMNKLNTVLLGGRSQPVEVKDMVIEEDMVVLRLPIGLKLSLKALSATAEAIHLLAPLMEESPFDQLHITRTSWLPEVLKSPAVHTAQKLVIEHYDFLIMNPQAVSAIFEDLPNLFVELKSLIGENLQKDDFSRVVRSWISNGRPDGTHYSVELFREKDARHFLEAIWDLGGVIRADDNRSVTFPMMNGLQLTVSYHASEAYMKDEDGKEVTKWIAELKVHGDAVEEF